MNIKKCMYEIFLNPRETEYTRLMPLVNRITKNDSILILNAFSSKDILKQRAVV